MPLIAALGRHRRAQKVGAHIVGAAHVLVGSGVGLDGYSALSLISQLLKDLVILHLIYGLQDRYEEFVVEACIASVFFGTRSFIFDANYMDIRDKVLPILEVDKIIQPV